MTLNLRLRGRVGSPRGRGRLTSEVAVGVEGGGCFPGNDTGFTGDVSDPTRPPTRPRPRTSTSYLVPRQRAFDATSHWRVLSRRVERFHILYHVPIEITNHTTQPNANHRHELIHEDMSIIVVVWRTTHYTQRPSTRRCVIRHPRSQWHRSIKHRNLNLTRGPTHTLPVNT